MRDMEKYTITKDNIIWITKLGYDNDEKLKTVLEWFINTNAVLNVEDDKNSSYWMCVNHNGIHISGNNSCFNGNKLYDYIKNYAEYKIISESEDYKNYLELEKKFLKVKIFFTYDDYRKK
jgi:hypothetical protein